MVTEVVNNVLSDNTNRHITIQNAVKEEVKKEPKKREKKAPAPKKPKEEKPVPEENKDNIIGQPCPLCGKGVIIKGKSAYGCSEWKSGCTFRKGFDE